MALADRLRKRGEYDNGRPLADAPAFFLGATAHPFAPPYDERPRHVLRKVALGADFIISQHIFDLARWRRLRAAAGRRARRARASTCSAGSRSCPTA